jgi:3-oxoacyl-[acyl-carrier-protein] synthase II
MGEGGGLFILEEYERAKARGAKIYAEIVGFGASQDTYKITEPDPTGHGIAKSILNALADANLTPRDVDLLIPNGLGIPTHDRAELNALKRVFGDGLSKPAIAPIKAQIGNLAAGSGVDAAAAVLGLFHDTIPAAINTHKVIDDLKLNVSPEVRQQTVNVSISNIYSLGGQNAALIFRKIS